MTARSRYHKSLKSPFEEFLCDEAQSRPGAIISVDLEDYSVEPYNREKHEPNAEKYTFHVNRKGVKYAIRRLP